METATAQGIQIRTAGIHHVTLRSTDLARAKVFYLERLGFPLLMETGALFIFAAGATAIAVRAPDANTPDDTPSIPIASASIISRSPAAMRRSCAASRRAHGGRHPEYRRQDRRDTRQGLRGVRIRMAWRGALHAS